MIEVPAQPPHTAVFLDKDGTIIEDVPYSVDPDRMRLLIGAAAGLRLVHEAGYQLVVVSTQSGVALLPAPSGGSRTGLCAVL
ncbi:hypothetical protein BH23PLA1_BH23PLA1_26160 [soil metagenome]